jgi:hypothetical protein
MPAQKEMFLNTTGGILLGRRLGTFATMGDQLTRRIVAANVTDRFNQALGTELEA